MEYFHCTIRACVDKIISIGHPGRNNIVARIKYCLDSLTMKRCCWGFVFFPQPRWQDHYPHLSSQSGMLNWYSKDCIQGRPQHGHTFLFADTDRKRAIVSGKAEAWSSWGAVLSHTTSAHRLSPFGSCSHTIISCMTKMMTGLKLRQLYGFIYILYVYQLSIFTRSWFQFPMQAIPLLSPVSLASSTTIQSCQNTFLRKFLHKFFFISIIP